MHTVHEEVNELKHTPKGFHDTRNVTYQEALNSVGELLALILGEIDGVENVRRFG